MIALALCTTLFTAAFAPGNLEPEIETALGTAGLSLSAARFDANLGTLFGKGEFTTPFFVACNENPWRMPFFVETLKSDFGTMAGRPSESLAAGSRLLGCGTRRTLLGDPSRAWLTTATKPNSFAEVLADMKTKGLIKANIPSIAGVPNEVQQAASLVLRQLQQVLPYRKLAFAGTDPAAAYEFFAKGATDDSNVEAFNKALRIYRSVDVSYLCAGGHDLFLAAQTAQSLAQTTSEATSYDFKVDTAWGSIHLTGGGATTHSDKASLLIIDTGGNDGYINTGGNASASNWASIIIDTHGDDHYLSDPALDSKFVSDFDGRKSGSQVPGPAGALLGYAVLLDSEGTDVYRTHRPGLGSGRLGCAALVDTTGDDIYDAYADGEGFGMFGVGILEDTSGDDKYNGFSQVQGVGQTMGFGYLVDRSGLDRYLANDTVIDNPSAQSADHNMSMSQGAGNGRRADYLDGHSLAGGIGILNDESGSDTYIAGVFAQGVGYWQSVGLLWDSKGNDVYRGQWYVQGAAAHFAIGYLEDVTGNDEYFAPMNMAQGAGHDFSLGFLLDREGDDSHNAPNLSLGAGNANGIGVMIDLAGNDKYTSSGITLGKSAEAPKQSLRSKAFSLGLFMDLAGGDTYPSSCNWAQNGSRSANWTDRLPNPSESQLGIFWDR